MAQIRSPRERQDEETDPAPDALSGAQARPRTPAVVGTRSNLRPAPKMLGFHIAGTDHGTGQITWSDGTYTVIESTDHFAFNTGREAELHQRSR